MMSFCLSPQALADAFTHYGVACTTPTPQLESAEVAPFQAVTADSRKVQLGTLFVALKGAKVDGHAYLAQAVQAGATALIVQHGVERPSLPSDVLVIEVANTYHAFGVACSAFYGLPAQRLQLIGVTGTNGKTTVTHLVQRILTHAQKKVALIGTLGVKAAQASNSYADTGNTTPLADVLQAYLQQLAEGGTDCVAMEVSSHALDQDRTATCEYDVAIHTNLTQDHLDYHVTMERYFQAKAKLFSQLNPTAIDGRPRHAVINIDDAWGQRFVEAVPAGVQVWTYGLKAEHATVRAVDVRYSVQGASYTVHTPVGSQAVQLQMAGAFSVYNSLAALATGLALGYPLASVVEALEGEPGVRGRFEVVGQGEGQPSVIIDYAHTPDGLENVLQAARDITPPTQKLWVVFGCGGDRDATKRPKMGAIADRLADCVVVTSDNPRSEQPQQIITDILGGLPSNNPERLFVEPDRRKAIALALTTAKAGDVVVLAGKGHETYQILADQTIHFDDKEEALAVLDSLG